jgi:hypothetical protein
VGGNNLKGDNMPNSLNIPDEVYEEFETLCGRLSPENLCCDGEISHAQVQVRLAQIKREWKALERKICRRVSQEEIENEWSKRMRG